MIYELQMAMDRTVTVGREFGMKVNVGKTKGMNTGNEDVRVQVTLEGNKLEEVNLTNT